VGAGEEGSAVSKREGSGGDAWVADGFGLNSGVGLVEGGETAGEGAITIQYG